MASPLVARWQTWRAERREEMLERLAWRAERGEHGGGPIAGGYGFKLWPSPFSSRSP